MRSSTLATSVANEAATLCPRPPEREHSRRGVVTRAAGEGPRDAGIDGQCESAHEADSGCNDSRRTSKEAEVRRRSIPLMKTRYALLLILGAVQTVLANDFPTRARVEFVLSCMRESKAPQQESMYKCSCAIDVIAEKVDYNTWVDLSTVANATTIAGERGGVMRDMKDGRKMIASFRELQEDAKKRCFIKD